MKAINVGDKVRMTGKFLRNTGQARGQEGQNRWVVQACDCGQGMCGNPQYVLTNERADVTIYTAAELKEQPCLKWRRINAANLEKVG